MTATHRQGGFNTLSVCPSWCTRDHAEAAKIGSTFHESTHFWNAELPNGGRRNKVQASIEGESANEGARFYVGVDHAENLLSPTDALTLALSLLDLVNRSGDAFTVEYVVQAARLIGRDPSDVIRVLDAWRSE